MAWLRDFGVSAGQAWVMLGFVDEVRVRADAGHAAYHGLSRPITAVARELSVSETSLGNWVRAYRDKHAGEEPPLQLSDPIPRIAL